MVQEYVAVPEPRCFIFLQWRGIMAFENGDEPSVSILQGRLLFKYLSDCHIFGKALV
jgi:hypothetical protein